jgi:hypothetical protein
MQPVVPHLPGMVPQLPGMVPQLPGMVPQLPGMVPQLPGMVPQLPGMVPQMAGGNRGKPFNSGQGGGGGAEYPPVQSGMPPTAPGVKAAVPSQTVKKPSPQHTQVTPVSVPVPDGMMPTPHGFVSIKKPSLPAPTAIPVPVPIPFSAPSPVPASTSDMIISSAPLSGGRGQSRDVMGDQSRDSWEQSYDTWEPSKESSVNRDYRESRDDRECPATFPSTLPLLRQRSDPLPGSGSGMGGLGSGMGGQGSHPGSGMGGSGFHPGVNGFSVQNPYDLDGQRRGGESEAVRRNTEGDMSHGHFFEARTNVNTVGVSGSGNISGRKSEIDYKKASRKNYGRPPCACVCLGFGGRVAVMMPRARYVMNPLLATPEEIAK